MSVATSEGRAAATTTTEEGGFDVAVETATRGPCHVDATARGFHPATVRLALPGDARGLAFSLSPLKPGVYGVAVDATSGAGIPGAVAERSATGDVVVADTYGRFFLPWDEGFGTVAVTAQRFAPSVVVVDRDARPDSGAARPVVARLLPLCEATVSGAEGGSLADAVTGSTLEIPEASLVDAATGQPFVGDAVVARAAQAGAQNG